MDHLMTSGDVARFFRRSVRTINKWQREQTNFCKGFKVGKEWMFYKEDLENYIPPMEDLPL